MICGVSDHAVMRACERALGVDVAGIRRDLVRRGLDASDAAVLAEISARGLGDVEAVRAALVPIRDWVMSYGAAAARWGGLRFVVRGGVMVTVMRAGVAPLRVG